MHVLRTLVTSLGACAVLASLASTALAMPSPGPVASPAQALQGSLWDHAAAAAQVSAAELYAIALAESGLRCRDGKHRPWPWTINSPRGAVRAPSKAAAQAALDRLVAAGETNIDIGLMQINWRAHAARFGHLDLLDPATNVRVAATILAEARATHPNQRVGIGRYHSWTAWRGDAYARRVSVWTRRVVHAS